jgi:hypothetical protein
MLETLRIRLGNLCSTYYASNRKPVIEIQHPTRKAMLETLHSIRNPCWKYYVQEEGA